MTTAPDSLLHPDALETMLVLAVSTPDGAFVEVGVYKGGSAWYLANLARSQCRTLHLFDTFTGIPEKAPIDRHEIGDFGDTSLEAVSAAIPDAIYHVGVFPPQNGPPLPEQIAFVHVDCDQYAVIKRAVAELWPRLVDGGVMLFDDYGVLAGATAAVRDACSALSIDVRETAQGKAYIVR